MPVHQPKPATQSPPTGAVATPGVRRLKKGDLLFSEGEMSRSMYFLKNGMIRIFKKKGEASIEIDTIRTGQVLGELAFLDGQARSASAEALTPCELVEVTADIFVATLSKMPDWLKLLLKTIVGRLRTASTRIRQLEQASTAVDYSLDGKRSQHYVFISPYDALKICAGILVTGSYYGKPTEDRKGITCKVGMISRYGNQIMGVPTAKVHALLDTLQQLDILTMEGTDLTSVVTIKDLAFIEQYIAFQNEENLLDVAKRHDVSPKAFAIMEAISKHIHKYPKTSEGLTKVNVAEVKAIEMEALKKDPFAIEDFGELTKTKYASQLAVKSSSEAYAEVEAESFLKAYRIQRFVRAIAGTNDQKQSAKK